MSSAKKPGASSLRPRIRSANAGRRKSVFTATVRCPLSTKAAARLLDTLVLPSLDPAEITKAIGARVPLLGRLDSTNPTTLRSVR